MSRFRSTYAVESSMVINAGGQKQALVCEPGGDVTVPDIFDRLVPKLCPGWVKVDKAEPKASEPESKLAEPEPKAVEPQKQHQGQNHKGGQR